MFRMLRNRKGQNTAEYAILIALVVAAAMAMQVYLKRSMQSGVKFAVDSLEKEGGGTTQYEPYYLQSKYDVATSSYTDTEDTWAGGKVQRVVGGAGGATAKTTTRSGYQKTLDTIGAN